jgi:RsbT co-antagonist protein rsbRD N-terminal domain
MSRRDTTGFLAEHRAAIIECATAALSQSHVMHYQLLGPEQSRERLEALYDQMMDAAARRDLGNIVRYARNLAQERFSAGYDLSEVQTAINALEEATWKEVFSDMQPDQFAATLGLVSTILGAVKDALAREYVSLATHSHAPSLDLSKLFSGAGTS